MPKLVDHEAYRLSIIQQALPLFVRHGYAGVGMRDLAQQFGISKSALYHYFPTKESLFQGVVEAVVQSDMAQLNAAAVQDAPFADKLDTFIEHLLAHEAWYVQQYLILTEYVRIQSEAEADSARQMQAAADHYATGIADFLGITREEGWALYLQLNGAILQRFFDGKRTDLRTMMAWLLQHLTAHYSPASGQHLGGTD